MNLLHGPAPSPGAIVTFVVLTGAVAGLVVAAVASAARAAGEDADAVARRRRNTALGLAAWLTVTGGAAAGGLVSNFDRMPPPLMGLVAVSLVLSTTFAFSSVGALLARGLPLAVLVGFQAFRLPLELILHQLSLDGVLPVQMTYDGMNYDIATGVTAIVVALLAAWGRLPLLVLRLWNVLGLVLLLTIVTIAILSAPFPFRAFLNDPPNTIVSTFPFVWLPTFLVQAAWVGHLLVLRRLRMERG